MFWVGGLFIIRSEGDVGDLGDLGECQRVEIITLGPIWRRKKGLVSDSVYFPEELRNQRIV